MRMWCQFVGDVILMPYYLMAAFPAPEVNFQETDANSFYTSGAPFKKFQMSFWAKNPFICWIFLLILEMCSNVEGWREEDLEMKDGGKVCLAWRDAEDDKAPILVIMTTLAGDYAFPGTNLAGRFFQSKGWRAVAMVKRGTGFSRPNHLKTPKNYCLESWDDTQESLEHIKSLYPHAKMYAFGISQGGAQIHRYMTKMGKDSLIEGAVSYDAGTDWTKDMVSTDRRMPLIANILATPMRKQFLSYCAERGLKKVKTPGGYEIDVEEVKNANCMSEVARCLMGPWYGFSPHCKNHEYLASIRPGRDGYGDLAKPLLFLGSREDLIVDYDGIERISKLWKENENIITVITPQGPHVCRFEGIFGRDWSILLTFDFLEKVHVRSNISPKTKHAA